MAQESIPKLYSYWRSSCSWRVRTSLALKGIEYEYIPVHLVKDGGQQHTDEYKQLNPQELVPTFVHGDIKLSQSLAILEYIEEAFSSKGPRLLPENAADKARVRMLCELIACDIQPVQNLKILLRIAEMGGDKMAWGKQVITDGFRALEKSLSTTSGTYCFGDQITLADCCLPPQIYNAKRFSVEMDQFPIISRIGESLDKIDAFQKSHPSQQPDAQ